MKKTKNTKRALLTSVLSMMLCIAMLAGSTFAWFTDSVTSGKNKIVAGNLDVELEYPVFDENGSVTEWKLVDSETSLFDENALWEPGYTQVVYLRVTNVGSLALKYKLGINVADKVIGKTADDKDIDLSKFIKFGVFEAKTEAEAETETEVKKPFADRDAARAAVEENAVLISEGYSSSSAEDKHLSAGKSSDMLALVAYMPETVGNEANHGYEKQAPSIDLGINLFATQYTEEFDSFDNQYDKDAPLNGIPAVTAAITKGAKDANAAIVEEITKRAEEAGEDAPANIDQLIYFDELTKNEKDELAITLHFAEGTSEYVDVTYTAVKALIGKAINEQASSIKTIKIATANERILNGKPFADESGDWVEEDLKAVMNNLTERTLQGALKAAKDGLPVVITDIYGKSQTYIMKFDLPAENW